uniref:Uncharacterized protein n=1 Tax=Anguilla anguilla TaxID=7936 RepID=A0A0E9TZ19_ANGAN
MLCLQERPVGSHGVQGDTAPNSSPFSSFIQSGVR